LFLGRVGALVDGDLVGGNDGIDVAETVGNREGDVEVGKNELVGEEDGILDN
jgi:hypothetical protein